jgi:OOP family OmpA-OmpF porin
MNKTKLLITCLSLGLASIASAQSDRKVYTPGASSEPSNVYVGFSLGQSRSKLTTTLSNDNDLAYGLMAGYRFNRNFSAEVAYFDLGEVSTNGTVKGTTDGVSVAGIGALALNTSTSLIGKFGVAQAKTSWSAAPAAGVATSQKKTGLLIGTGLSFDVARNTEVRLSYDRYFVGSDDPVTGNAQVLSLAAAFRF